MLRENEKLKSDRGSRRNPANLFARRPESGTQNYRGGLTNFLNTSGMSFEEFSKRGDEGSHGDASSTAASP